MAEYIERKKLIEFACRHVDGQLDANDIARFPTADVVPVVRCKDCEKYNIFGCADGFGWCESFHNGVTDEHYCSHGERRCSNE